jgi:hypothetical protein
VFSSSSRYASARTSTVRTARGDEVRAIQLPVRPRPAVDIVHTRADEQRLDHIAAHYLRDPTAFWRLCDAANVLAPDALAARREVPVPIRERGR